MTSKLLASKLESRIYETTKNYESVQNLCYEAVRFGFASVQVFPNMIDRCKQALNGANVAINAVIAYPHGGLTIGQKAAEAADAVAHGATEVEVVMNTREAKSGNFDYLEQEMRAVKETVGAHVTVKFTIEIECLTDAEAVQTCKAAAKAGIDYLSTSTGLYHTLNVQKQDVPLVANPREIRLLVEALKGSGVKVQAEGYIETADVAQSLLEAGAQRISAEYAVRVMNSLKEEG